MKNKQKLTNVKDEDGYVDDWQIRKYSDCHPSSAVRVWTKEDINDAIEQSKIIADNFGEIIDEELFKDMLGL